MPNNYILLETIELTQSAASVTFDNLPTSGYTDLKVVVSARSTANGGQNMNLTFNSTTSGYSDKILSGNGSAAASFSSGNTSRGGSCVMPGADFTANTFGNGEIYIPNYRGSNAKSFSSDSVSENNATLSYNQMQATLWNNSAAITNILIDLSGGSFAANSTFSLYGIAALGTTPVLAPKATGGNIVANDGTYWYHAFTSSGNFVPQVGLTADVLQIAGGGGGGGNGGGGGAGGLLAHTSQSLANGTNYSCIIGAGSAGGVFGTSGSRGSDSQFASLTASTGGGAGNSSSSAWPNKDGGSGGGKQGSGTVGLGTVGQGNNGGQGVNTSQFGCGGGGGAGAIGADGTTSTGGAGGNGLSTYSSWGLATLTGQNVSGTVWYAGGGGGCVNSGTGGVGGNGGGGTGTGNLTDPKAPSGTANTGGGGAGGGGTGSSPNYEGGNGGSGIVIIRYPIN